MVVQFEVAEECFGHAKDLSGLLLLHSALGNAQGLTDLAVAAKEQGKINVAFLSLFLLGKVEDCVQLLIDRYPYSYSSLLCTHSINLWLCSLHVVFAIIYDSIICCSDGFLIWSFLWYSNRIPEAAFMARTYTPSEVSNVVALWRNDLKKVNHSGMDFPNVLS